MKLSDTENLKTKYETPNCPECSQPAIGTSQTLSGCALFDGDPTAAGSKAYVAYNGVTRIHWNSQKTDRATDGRVMLECDNGHSWPSNALDSFVVVTVPLTQTDESWML